MSNVKRFCQLLMLIAFCLSFSLGLACLADVKQIYALSKNQSNSIYLGITGVQGYIVTAKGNRRGILVTAVNERGLAGRAGISEGDVILGIDNRDTASPGDADQVLDLTPAGPVTVVFARQFPEELNLFKPLINYPGGRTMRAQGKAAAQPAQESIIDLESYAFDLINQDRALNGALPPVALDIGLSSVARDYARDMARRGFKGHTDPEGREPHDRAKLHGITTGVWENIAWRFGGNNLRLLVKECEESMMNEPDSGPINHRMNILRKQHQFVGVGIALSRKGEVILVQEFTDRQPH